MTESPTVPDVTLRMTRVFNAPPGRVFQAFVDAEAMRIWFCPTGFSFDAITVDRATGRGTFFAMVHGATGHRFEFELDYTLVDPPHGLNGFLPGGTVFPRRDEKRR